MLKNRWTFLKGFNSNLPTVSRPSFTASSTFLQQLPLLSIKTLDGGLGSICPQVVLSSLSAICCPTLAKPTPLSGQWVWATVAADHRDLRTKENVLPPLGLQGWVLLCLPPPSLSHILVFLLNPICCWHFERTQRVKERTGILTASSDAGKQPFPVGSLLPQTGRRTWIRSF